MCSSVEPIVPKVHTQKAQVPRPRGVPWEGDQMEIVEHKCVCHQFDCHDNQSRI